MTGEGFAVNPAARKQAAAWNQAHQVGAEVAVAMPDGSTRRTRTRSEAFCMFVKLEHAQVYLEGFGGMVSLARVRVAAPRAAQANAASERREDAWTA